MEPYLPLDIVDVVVDHLANEATRQRPLLDDDELSTYKIYLTTLLRLGATCRALQRSSRRALWRSVDLDVSPRPKPEAESAAGADSINISVVFPFDLTLPLWTVFPASHGSSLVMVPSSCAFSIPVEHVRKLSVLVYSSSCAGVHWQIATLMSLLRLFPGPLRSVHIHGVTLPNSALIQILTHLSSHLTTFTLSQHGKVMFDDRTDRSGDRSHDDWVYDLSHVNLPVLERLYFEAWLSLPDSNSNFQPTRPSVQVKSLPFMPSAATVNVKARTASSSLACSAAYPNMFFWVKRWLPSTDPHSATGPCRLGHLGVFIEKDPFPFDLLLSSALAAIHHLHVKSVVLTRASPFVQLTMSSLPGLRDLTLTNFLAISLAHVPWTRMPNLESLTLAGDAKSVSRDVLHFADQEQDGLEQAVHGWVVAEIQLPLLRTLTLSHKELAHSRSTKLSFRCPRLARLVVGFSDWLPEIFPVSVLSQLSVERVNRW